MNFDDAQKVMRPTIRVGQTYEFHSTVTDARVNTDTNEGALIRSFSEQRVRVIEQTFKPGHEDWIPGESERLYRVRADDGTEFEAYQGELNGWYKDTRQFYTADGKFARETADGKFARES